MLFPVSCTSTRNTSLISRPLARLAQDAKIAKKQLLFLCFSYPGAFLGALCAFARRCFRSPSSLNTHPIHRAPNRSPYFLTRGVKGDLHSCLLPNRLGSSSNSILRVLRALRGEFPLTSVWCEPKLDVTPHSKRQGTLKISLQELLYFSASCPWNCLFGERISSVS
jgi:hypothetical protein